MSSELSDADKALLASLKRQRAGHKGTLTKYKNYIDKINTQELIDEKIYHNLCSRLEKLEPLYEQYRDIECQIFNIEFAQTTPGGDELETDFFFN